MEWSEFTQYIIDAVIGEKDAKFFDGILSLIIHTQILSSNFQIEMKNK